MPPVLLTFQHESADTTEAVIRVGRDKEISLDIMHQIQKTLIH
jgi:hypothetical protein